MTLDLVDLSKVYRGGKRAVDGLTMRLGRGVFGLLGPNGAGKSSLLRMIATVTRPTSGRILLDGEDITARPEAMRRVLGYLPQDFGVYPHLNALEFLGYLAAAKGLSARAAKGRIAELLELVNLTAAAKRPLGGYSGGMLRRVGIAQTLLTDPRVIVVDEPTAGLDPEERMRFRNLLAALASERIVVLSTHIVADIESVTDDIAIMAGGRLVRRGTAAQLVRTVTGQVWETVGAVPAGYPISRITQTAGGTRIRLLSAGPPPGINAVPVAGDLEDAYLAVVR